MLTHRESCQVPVFLAFSLSLWGEPSVAGAVKVVMMGHYLFRMFFFLYRNVPGEREFEDVLGDTTPRGTETQEGQAIWLLSLKCFREGNIRIVEKPFLG